VQSPCHACTHVQAPAFLLCSFLLFLVDKYTHADPNVLRTKTSRLRCSSTRPKGPQLPLPLLLCPPCRFLWALPPLPPSPRRWAVPTLLLFLQSPGSSASSSAAGFLVSCRVLLPMHLWLWVPSNAYAVPCHCTNASVHPTARAC